MISGAFSRLGRDASLVAELGPAVFEFFTSVVGITYLFEVLFDHIYESAVVFVVDTRVTHNKDSVLVKGVRHLLAFGLPAFAFLKVELEVDDGDFGRVCRLGLRSAFHLV